MIFGAILAGGVGSRMNIESMPKQYLPLNEKPVFIHTLEKFLLCSEFDAVFIGTHGDWAEYTKDAVAQYGFGETPVHVVQGGAIATARFSRSSKPSRNVMANRTSMSSLRMTLCALS